MKYQLISIQDCTMKISNNKKITFKVSVIALSVMFSHTSLAAVVNVYNANELQSALKSASAGDEIVLNVGSYIGNKSTSGDSKAHFYSSKSGTASNPITLRSASSSNKQVLSGNNVDSGYLFYLEGNYWVVKDLKFSTAQKGIMLEGANSNEIDNVEIFNLGAEAVHMRYFSSDNVLSNCYIHDTGKRVGQEGFGEGVYIGTHDGHTAEKLDKSDNNRIGGCVIGPDVTAEAFDIKAGVSGTVIESNSINGSGIIGDAGNPAADSFIDLKGTDNIIRNNRLNWGGDNNIAHAIFTYQEHRSSNIYDNEITLGVNLPTYKLLEETVHAQNNVRLDGGTQVVDASYQLNKIDSNLDQSIEKPAASYTCFDELNNGCEATIITPDPDPEPTPTPNCEGIKYITWKDKTEVNLSATNCIRFDRDVANKTVQAWDSDVNTSCDFRGQITSIDNGSISANIAANYQAVSNLSGTVFKLLPENNCQYIKLRAY